MNNVEHLLCDQVSDMFVQRVKDEKEAWSAVAHAVKLSMRGYLYDATIKPWLMANQPNKPNKPQPSTLCMALLSSLRAGEQKAGKP